MITLEFANNSDIDDRLWDTFNNQPEQYFYFGIIEWFNSLDYVLKYEYNDNDVSNPPMNTFYFETEQDKLFFLLKYS